MLIELLGPLWWVFLASAFVMGSCFGSFLNVCIARWPHDQSVVSPPSRCPRCEQQIAWHDNVPILGWLWLRGQCRRCALPISWQYPLVELLVGLGWLTSAWHFGASLEALRVATFGTVLLGIGITDAKTYLIPDGFTVSGLVLMLGFALANVFIGESSRFAPLWPAFLGACAGAGAITLIGWIAEVIMKREAMGFGDTTLMAVVGAAVGIEKSLLTIVAGAFVGAVTFVLIVGPILRVRAARRQEAFAYPEVPFGVFLAPAALLVLLWGDALLAWYLSYVFAI
jgi:leader peptidase (prepilin peptidase)/N-methyltransferase